MPEALFPPIEPYAADWLDAGEGHRLRYEECGRRDGVPALFLHGGPGSSIGPNHRRFFDPTFYRIVLADQRGCGQSTPAGGLAGNTLEHLIGDIERLREHLGVRRWMLFGGSWGSTLAIAYAQAHPDRVSALVLRGLFLGTDDEVHWFLTGLARFLPEAWNAFASAAADQSAQGLLRDYEQRVQADDAAAAARWTAWEGAVMAVGEAPSSAAIAPTSGGALARVRVQLHYLVHHCFLGSKPLLPGLDAMQHVPAIMIQGRRDLVCPPLTAYTVAQRWRAAELRMVEDGGHSAMHPSMASALVQATQDIKQRLLST
jgi:proline iminopeptidase